MLRERLRTAREKLQSVAIPTSDAEFIAAFILGVERMQLHAREYELNSEQESEFEDLLEQRLNGAPLQYLTGIAPFRYLDFEVGFGVLIPRPETELLVDAALVEIERIQAAPTWNHQPTSIVDLGSGSGAIAISIAHEARQRQLPVQIVAVESEIPAITWLTRNIAKHQVDVRVIEGRVEDALLDVKCDLVVANPPYIPSNLKIGSDLPIELGFEPSSALFGGEAGLDIPYLFINAAARILKGRGLLLLEHHESQVASLSAELAAEFTELKSLQDLNQRPRWISARKRESRN
jgi:release factor glutamine methyltransferase